MNEKVNETEDLNGQSNAKKDIKTGRTSEKELAREKLALKLIQEGKLDEAEKLYRDLINEGTNSYIVYTNLAVIIKSKGYIDDAIELTMRSIQINPLYINSFNNLETTSGVGLSGSKIAVAPTDIGNVIEFPLNIREERDVKLNED